MLQYFAKKFFNPILVSADISQNNSITISLISDLTHDVPDVVLKTEVFKWDSLKPIEATNEMVTLVNNFTLIFFFANNRKKWNLRMYTCG